MNPLWLAASFSGALHSLAIVLPVLAFMGGLLWLANRLRGGRGSVVGGRGGLSPSARDPAAGLPEPATFKDKQQAHRDFLREQRSSPLAKMEQWGGYDLAAHRSCGCRLCREILQEANQRYLQGPPREAG